MSHQVYLQKQEPRDIYRSMGTLLVSLAVPTTINGLYILREGRGLLSSSPPVIVFILAHFCPHLRRKIIESTYSLFLLGQTFSTSKTSHWDNYSNLKAKVLPKGRVKNKAIESFGLSPAWWLTLAILNLRSRGKSFQTKVQSQPELHNRFQVSLSA